MSGTFFRHVDQGKPVDASARKLQGERSEDSDENDEACDENDEACDENDGACGSTEEESDKETENS